MTEPIPQEIFVYGTLLPGQANHRWIASLIAGRMTARTRGRLFHLPFGYPAMVESATGWVRGELLSFNNPVEEALEVCDQIEGYMPGDEVSSLFVRVVRQVEPAGAAPCHAWCYCLAPQRVEKFTLLGQEIDDGDWLAFVSRRE